MIFLRTLMPGASNRSYGIQVARLAGLPSAVIDRAKGILHNLEGTELDSSGKPRIAGGLAAARGEQMALFHGSEESLRAELKQIDVGRVTPIEAIGILNQLVEKAKQEV